MHQILVRSPTCAALDVVCIVVMSDKLMMIVRTKAQVFISLEKADLLRRRSYLQTKASNP
jgi:hypothetical protein